MLLIGPGIVITFGEKCRVLQDAGVLVDGESIKAVGDFHTLATAHKDAERLDADGRVILPGLVNAHMHFYSTFARGMALSGPPATNFTEILERLWWRLDKKLEQEDCYLSAIIPILAGLKYGVTTYIDHHASPFYKDATPLGSLEETAQAVIDTGVRACLCYEISDRDGETIALAGISENERFIEMCQDGHGGGRLAGMIGLHAQFTCSDATLEQAKQVNDYLHCGFHVHCAEDKADVEDARRRGFAGAVARLHEFGLLGDRSILAHCVHVSDEEVRLLAESKTAATHQPTSNMNNAVGAADISRLIAAGVPVGVGTDGMSPNVWDDYRAASWLMRHRAGDPRAGWSEPHRMLTVNNPLIATRCFGRPIGVLAEGALADVAVMDYYPPTPLTEQNAAGHLLFGISYMPAWHVVCHGKVLLKDKALQLKIDEESLASHAREHAAELWERLK